VSENVEPFSEADDPFDEVDNCAVTRYSGDGRTGSLGATGAWSKDAGKTGATVRGVSGIYCGSLGGVGG